MTERRQEGLVADHVRVDATPPARLEPLEPAVPLPVHGLRRPVHAAGRALALEHQLPLARAVPEGPHDWIVDVGQRIVGVERQRHWPRSTSALGATPETPVT